MIAKLLAASAVVLLSCGLAGFDADRSQRSGGWRPEDAASPLLLSAEGIRQQSSSGDVDAAAFPARCTLRRVRLADLEDDPTEPVIIVDLQAGWRARERWRKDELVRLHGSIEVWVGDSLAMGREGPETVSGGTGRQRQRLGDFVHSGMRGRYTFDRSTVFQDYPSLHDDFSLPAPFEPSASAWSHLTFSVGPSSEGLGFHYHDAAINAVVYGSKRWFTCVSATITSFAVPRLVLSALHL